MSKTRKDDTTPVTKADITLILEKLGTMADDASASRRSIESLERRIGEHQKDFATLQNAFASNQNAFAEHDKIMHVQFETILKHIDGKVEEVSEHFDNQFEKLDDACFDKAVTQDSSLRELDRRLREVERRVGVPS